MGKIFDRGGNEITLALVGQNGNEKKLSMEEFDYIYSAKNPYPVKRRIRWIVNTGLLRRDPAYFILLVKFIIRRTTVDNAFDARKELAEKIRSDLASFNSEMNELWAFRIKYFKIGVKGKTIFILPTRENDAVSDSYWHWLFINEVFIANKYDVSEKNIRDKIVVDAGANIGLFSLYCALFGAKKVHAFEPVGETYNLLKKNIELNNMSDVVTPINKALGESVGQSEISVSSAGDAAPLFVLTRRARTNADRRSK